MKTRLRIVLSVFRLHAEDRVEVRWTEWARGTTGDPGVGWSVTNARRIAASNMHDFRLRQRMQKMRDAKAAKRKLKA